MKLNVPLKYLDLKPSFEIVNFDFNYITDEQWRATTKLKSIHFFSEMDVLPIITSETGFQANTPDVVRNFCYTDHEIFPLVIQEVEKLEKYYNAKCLFAVFDMLRPGARIFPHTDQSPLFVACHRVHLPLVTHIDAKLIIEGNSYFFEPGIYIEVDNRRLHEAINLSNINRIHLVIDLLPLNG